MKLGEIVNKRKPTFGTNYNVDGEPLVFPAKVVYIHPQRRYYTLEFVFGERKFRESYSFRG